MKPDEMKDVASSVTVLMNDKIKAEKEKEKGGKKKKGNIVYTSGLLISFSYDKEER